MTYKELNKQIKNRNLVPVYLFYGEEEYLIDYFVENIKKTFIPKEVESLNFATLDGERIDLEDIYNACETLPFMSEKRVVVVKNLNIFSRKGRNVKAEKNFDKNDRKKLEEYIAYLSDDICLIFLEKGKKADKSKKIVKKINDIGGLIEFNKLTGRDLDNWIKKSFKEQNKNISKTNINYLIQASAYFDRNAHKTLYDLKNEIIKLTTYLGNRKEIKTQDIDNIVAKSLERNIFKLLNSISEKNVNNSLKIFNEMYMLNEPIQLILHMIIRQFRLMLMYKVLKAKGYYENDISKKMKVKFYEFNKIKNYSRNFSMDQLEKGLNLCLKVDKYLKTSSMNEKLLMEMLLINLCKLSSYK